MKILLLDIETAPHRVYAWGLFDQNIALNQIEEPGYTLCWAAKWLGEKGVKFSSLVKDGHKRMIEKVHALINEADAVVHYHGTRFDMPTLNQEFVLCGLKPPSSYKQIDLLKTVRKQFRLPSNKLDYVARHLGLKGKLAHKGMDLWKGCMKKDAKSWEEMEAYNIQDVLTLETVYIKLLPWIIEHPNQNLYTDKLDRVCPTCSSKNLQSRGTTKSKTMIYKRFQCNDCGSWSRERVTEMPKEKKAAILVADRG